MVVGPAVGRGGGRDLDLWPFDLAGSAGRSRLSVFVQERGRDVSVRAGRPLVVPRNWQQAIDGVHRHGLRGLAVRRDGVIVIGLALARDLAEGGGVVSNVVNAVVPCGGEMGGGERGGSSTGKREGLGCHEAFYRTKWVRPHSNHDESKFG